MRIPTEKPVGNQEVNLHKLERRVVIVEKELAAMAIANRGGVAKNPTVEGNKVPGPKLTKTVPYRTINEGKCIASGGRAGAEIVAMGSIDKTGECEW